jgi:hypothetical protein
MVFPLFLFFQGVPPMNWLRRWSVPAFVAILSLTVPGIRAQEQPGSAGAAKSAEGDKWLLDRTLKLTPRPEPRPALAYRLFPLAADLKEGNAVPIYLRLNHEQNDAARRDWAETPAKWNNMPLDQIPLDEARTFLKRYRTFLRQFELGARRKTAEWSYTFDQGSVIDILLPDAQSMRGFVPLLLLKARVELAQGHFAAAAHWLETGFAFSRQVGSGPFLINRLVGIACAGQFLDCVLDFVQQPGAPNLYWSLSSLPSPLIDLRDAIDFEYRVLELEFPDLAGLDRPRAPGEWDRVLKKVRTHFERLVGLDEPRLKPTAGMTAADPASRSPDLPAARKHLIDVKKLPDAKVQSMPPAQVVLLYLVDTYNDFRDEWFKTAYLPYQEARQRFIEAERRFKAAPETEGGRFAHLLPAFNKVRIAQLRIERKIAALRTIEALRAHAAAHDGRLPDKLADVTIVPIPDDPGTGRPFIYQRDGDTATLISRLPGERLDVTGLRYRLVIKGK